MEDFLIGCFMESESVMYGVVGFGYFCCPFFFFLFARRLMSVVRADCNAIGCRIG